jgi:hypothetical protein
MLVRAISTIAVVCASICATAATVFAQGEGKAASTKDVSAKDVSTKDVSTNDASTKDASTKDVSTKDVSTKDVSTKDVSTKAASAGDVSVPSVPLTGGVVKTGTASADDRGGGSSGTSSGTSDLPGPATGETTAGLQSLYVRKKLDKLKLAVFPNYDAKILMPIQYQKRDESSQLTAMGADLPHGIYMFLGMTGPAHETLTPEKIKPIIKGTIEGMKAECSSETPIKFKQFDGIECRGKVKVDADVEAIVRGYVAGHKMYFVSAMGTSAWIHSKDVTRYLESFEITP